MSEAACPSCGLAVAGGTEGCQSIFEAIGLREYEDMRFARYHRIVVDVYAMQHPDRYGRSAKSFAAHLTGLCAWLEDEDGAHAVNAAVQRWLSGPSPIVRPTLPPSHALSRSATCSMRWTLCDIERRCAAGRERHGTRTSRSIRSREAGSRPLLHGTRDSDQPGADPYDRRTSYVLNGGRTVSYSLTLR